MNINRKLSTIIAFAIAITISSTNIIAIDKDKYNNADIDQNRKINITRISGKDRYETAVNINRYLFNVDESIKLKYAVLVSGDSFADAISGGLLASEYNCPILLTSKENIPDSTNNYLSNFLFVNKVFVVGGESSISKNVENKLGRTIRLNGKNRYETARLASLEMKDLNFKYIYGDKAAAYNGFSFSDAIAAAPFIYQYNKGKETMLPLYPIIDDLQNNNLDGVVEIAFGGKSSLPFYHENMRFSGKDRYQTSVSIAKGFKTNLNIDISTVIIANGENYPDALASTPLATRNNAAILLTKSDKINSDTMEYIKSNPNIKNIIIVGGENSVSKNAENELRAIRN